MGMVGIMDPPRVEARPAVTTLQSTGVRVKMVTGDAHETACAIALAVGLQVKFFWQETKILSVHLFVCSSVHLA